MPHLIQQLRERLALSRAPFLVSLEPRNALSGKVGFSFYIDMHVVVQGNMTVRAGHDTAHAVKNQILVELPQVAEVLIHIEPEEELSR